MTAAAGSALDLHEGIAHPGPRWRDPAAAGCKRWPETLRLRSSNGELVRGRCRSTNLCAYCAKLAAVENSELLALDALAGDAPQVWAVLTTPSTSTDPADFYDARRLLVRALRRRWPHLEWSALVEFTTGYGPLSGGARRPHWNLLLKGVTPDDLAAVHEVIARVWCPRVGGHPSAQHVGPVSDAGGLMRYIALHFQKESQAPPHGWRGHRFLKSRGYLSTSTPEARAAAKRSLRHKREVWRALARGLDSHDAELAAHEAMAIADATTWVLMQPSLQVRKSIDTEVPPCPDATATPAGAQSAGFSPPSTNGGAASSASAPSNAAAADAASSWHARNESAALPPAPSPTEQPATARPGRQPRRAPAPDRCPRPDDSRRPPPSPPDRGRLTADALPGMAP